MTVRKKNRNKIIGCNAIGDNPYFIINFIQIGKLKKLRPPATLKENSDGRSGSASQMVCLPLGKIRTISLFRALIIEVLQIRSFVSRSYFSK